MAQNKVELLAGSGNFPRTDNKKTPLVPDPDEKLNRGDNIMTGVATRSVAQLAESSKAMAPFLQGVNVELKAIRTELKPNKGILKSLEKIEKHLALANKGNGKGVAVRGAPDDRRLAELTQSMSRSVIITDNIAQNTAYIAHAMDELVRTRDTGGGQRDRDAEGPREAVEEKKNKRLSKTFADSLDNSRMAKEMEKGFKKVSAMQALNSFANLGQGGGKALMGGLVDIIGKGVFNALTNPLVLGAGIGWALGQLTGHLIDKQSDKVNAQRNAAHTKALEEQKTDLDKIHTITALAKQNNVSLEGYDVKKMVYTLNSANRAEALKKLAEERAKADGNKKKNLFDYLTDDEKLQLTAALHLSGEITSKRHSEDLTGALTNGTGGWKGFGQSQEVKDARKYFDAINGINDDVKTRGYAKELTARRASAREGMRHVEKAVGYTGSGTTGGTQIPHNVLPSSNDLYHPEYSNDPTLKKMDDMMRSINPHLSGKDLAKLIEHETGGSWNPHQKTGARAPGTETDEDIFDPETNQYRPSSAIGIGQWTRKAMKDMKGHGVNTHGSFKDYYESFREKYPTVDSQLPLFEEHWRSKGVLGTVANLSREDALKALYVAHFAGGGAVNKDGSINEKTTDVEKSQNNGMTRAGYASTVMGKSLDGLNSVLGSLTKGASPSVAWSENHAGSSVASTVSASTGKDVSGEVKALIENGHTPNFVGGGGAQPANTSTANGQPNSASNIFNSNGGNVTIKIEGGSNHSDLYNGGN